MDVSSPAPPKSRPPWDGALSPVRLATYVMWLVVALQAIDWTALANGTASAWIGLGCLVAAIVLYAVASQKSANDLAAVRSSVLLIVGEGVAIVAASWLMREGLLSILLTIVAAQLYARTRRVDLLIAVMACLDVAILLTWLPLTVWSEALMIFLPVTGQAFTVAMVHYAGSLERSRNELARLNTELLATRALLDESARGQERLKLSRELHDVAGHKLTALKLNLSRLERDAQVGRREEISIAVHLTEELLTDVRAVVTELRRYDGIDVRAGIEALTARIPGVRFEIAIPEAARASSVETAEALLRCAQEGITNALRHGSPTTITIECRRRNGHLELRVRDDGLYVPRIRFGNGLTGMRERIEGVGGRLQIGAAAGRGVELVASVPMADSK